MAKMHSTVYSASVEQDTRIKQLVQARSDAAEERVRVATAKSKGRTAHRKRNENAEGFEAAQNSTSQVASGTQSVKGEAEDDFDLFKPSDFEKALKERVGRPFVFGPVDLVGLDKDSFDRGRARTKI